MLLLLIDINKFQGLDRAKLNSLKLLTAEMVREFAQAARQKLNTTWSISELSAMGPAGTPCGHGP